jgi:hypothetical protein
MQLRDVEGPDLADFGRAGQVAASRHFLNGAIGDAKRLRDFTGANAGRKDRHELPARPTRARWPWPRGRDD